MHRHSDRSHAFMELHALRNDGDYTIDHFHHLACTFRQLLTIVPNVS